jgi:hypothetical protein
VEKKENDNYHFFALLGWDGGTPVPGSAWDVIAQIRNHVFDLISKERKFLRQNQKNKCTP